MVGHRAQELAEEIAVRVVDLDDVEARFDGSLRSIRECLYDVLDFGLRQLSDLWERIRVLDR